MHPSGLALLVSFRAKPNQNQKKLLQLQLELRLWPGPEMDHGGNGPAAATTTTTAAQAEAISAPLPSKGERCELSLVVIPLSSFAGARWLRLLLFWFRSLLSSFGRAFTAGRPVLFVVVASPLPIPHKRPTQAALARLHVRLHITDGQWPQRDQGGPFPSAHCCCRRFWLGPAPGLQSRKESHTLAQACPLPGNQREGHQLNQWRPADD